MVGERQGERIWEAKINKQKGRRGRVGGKEKHRDRKEGEEHRREGSQTDGRERERTGGKEKGERF